MTLTIHLPESCPAERRYVTSLMFEEFLGIAVRMVVERRSDVAISGGDGKELVLADVFFPEAEAHWLEPTTMPRRPLKWLELPMDVSSPAFVERKLPIVFGDAAGGPLVVQESPSRIRSPLDVLGSIFFLVTRYEELAASAADEHGRFPATASLAFQEGFLDRPIVDEYVELLWQLLSSLWPALRRKEQRYQIQLSHDVDTPYRVFGRPRVAVALAAGADVALGRGIGSAARRLQNAHRVYRGDVAADPYNTFDFILSTSEAHSLQSAFYFITRRRKGRLDGTHQFASPIVEQLIQSIYERGHEIGLHPGYGTFCNSQNIADEFELLRRQCARLGVHQSTWGGRQHYLRWKNPTTWAAWDQAGLDYDSTLGYSRDVGFRCGTCREYPVYDLLRREPLTLRERPLIVMECALSYRYLEPEEACYERVRRLIDRCKRVQGNFTLLWHNNNLASPQQRAWYQRIVAVAA